MHSSYVALLLLAASAAAPALAAPTRSFLYDPSEKLANFNDISSRSVDSGASAPLAVGNLDLTGLLSGYDDQDEHLNARDIFRTILSGLDAAAQEVEKAALAAFDGRDIGPLSGYDDQDEHLNARDIFRTIVSGLDAAAQEVEKAALAAFDERDIGPLSGYDDQDEHLNARNIFRTILSGLDAAGQEVVKAALAAFDARDVASEQLTARRDVDHSITRSSTPEADPNQTAAILNAIFSGLEGKH